MSERERALSEDDGLERELRVALGRVDPPDGFAERVLSRAAEAGGRGGEGDGRGGWGRAVAASFLLGALSGGWLMHHERVERREAMETREQFRVAMQVTARVTERSFSEAGRRINRTTDEGETR